MYPNKLFNSDEKIHEKAISVIPEFNRGNIKLHSFSPSGAENFTVSASDLDFMINFTPTNALFASSKIIISIPRRVSSSSCIFRRA